MTVKELERDVLSLRSWAVRSVLPTALILVIVLLVLRRINPDATILDHSSVIVGFFAAYFILVRGGHLIMIRQLHGELKRLYPETYTERLAALPNLKGRNAGFALARLKRDMINDGVIPNQNALKK